MRKNARILRKPNALRLADWHQKQIVEIYRSNQPVQVLTKPAILSGEEILPGFTLDLQFLWQDLAA